MKTKENFYYVSRVTLNSTSLLIHWTHVTRHATTTCNKPFKIENFTCKVLVFLDGELDDVVRVLKDASAVLQRTVVESHIINGKQLISRLNRTSPDVQFSLIPINSPAATDRALRTLSCAPHIAQKVLFSHLFCKFPGLLSLSINVLRECVSPLINRYNNNNNRAHSNLSESHIQP